MQSGNFAELWLHMGNRRRRAWLEPEIRDAIGALYGAGHTIVERSRRAM